MYDLIAYVVLISFILIILLFIYGSIRKFKLHKRIRHEYEKQKKYIFVFSDPKYEGQYFSKAMFDEFKEFIVFDNNSVNVKKPKTDMHWLATEVFDPEDYELGDDFFTKDNQVNNIGWRYKPIGIIVMTPKKFKVISYISHVNEDIEEENNIKQELRKVIKTWE